MRIVVATVLVPLMLACSRPEQLVARPDQPRPVESAKAPEPPTKKPFVVKTFDPAAVPPELKLEGRVEAGAAWTDAHGDNLAIFTKRTTKTSDGMSSVYLRVYHSASSASATWSIARPT